MFKLNVGNTPHNLNEADFERLGEQCDVRVARVLVC